MSKSVVKPAGMAPPPGPYSHGVRAGDFLFVAGQVARDANGNTVGVGDAGRQAEQALENVKAVLEAAGATLADVVDMTVFVTDIGQLPAVSSVRRRYFTGDLPASASVEVKGLANPELMVEIKVIAYLGPK